MIVAIQHRRMMQLSLFEEEIEAPHWQELNESTRKDAVRHLAQLMSHAQEVSAARTATAPGGQDE